MPRDIPVGNGNMLVAFNRDYAVNDFYFPYVGKENQTGGRAFRFGVWVDGRFSWVQDPSWTKRMLYQEDTLLTSVILENAGLGLRLVCQDGVDFHENIYFREVIVQNESAGERTVRLYFHHDFRLYETSVGNTAYYDPDTRSLIHYKDQRYFLCNVAGNGRAASGWDQFATGSTEVNGMQGTWADAEDGDLSGNPIAQGSVDSVGGVGLVVGPHGKQSVYYYICAATSYEDLVVLQSVVNDKGIPVFLTRTRDYWRLWVNKMEFDYDSLPPGIVGLYKHSLLILRTQINNSGAIIAGNDSDIIRFGSDTYSYMWPRDGALCSIALDASGYPELTAQFFAFCRTVITQEGYFLHNYNPDGTLGSSWHPWYQNGMAQIPIQEDETALVVLALWLHFDQYRDVETLKPLYRDLIVRAADFMLKYRDETTGLPLASYDLWEERRGVLTNTVAAVWMGLSAASNFANVFGERELADRYAAAADKMKLAADKYLWLEDRQRFARMITFSDGYDKPPIIDDTIDSATSALFKHGMYKPNDPKIVANMQAIIDRLWIKTDVGGLARYENDYYHQVSNDVANVAGNPWFVTTLWIAQWYIAKAADIEELEPALEIFEWVEKHALPSGVLAEQLDPYTGSPLSVSPLTWSQAELCTTIISYLDKLSELSTDPQATMPSYAKEHIKFTIDRRRRDCISDGARLGHPSAMRASKHKA